MSGPNKTVYTYRLSSNPSENTTKRIDSSPAANTIKRLVGQPTENTTTRVNYVFTKFGASPDAGVYALSGNDISALRGLRSELALGTFTLTGNTLSALRSLRGDVDAAAAFLLTGNTLSATYSGNIMRIVFENGTDGILLENSGTDVIILEG